MDCLDETVSISKGCFLFNPNANRGPSGNNPKTKRRRSQKRTAKYFTADKFPLLKGENDEQATLRYTHFRDCWTKMSLQIENIQIDLNKKVFDDLLTFIKTCHDSKGFNSTKREIPTAALLTGVNMPDHDVIFQQITTDIVKDITPHVALLQSKDCTNLKFLLREVLTQLMTVDEENGDKQENLNKSCIEDMGKLKQFTIGVLQTWYTRNTSSSDKPPIVVVLEDFEGFQKSVLQDFILICSEYIEDLPIILVFSLATTLDAVHKSLPHSVSTRLSIEKFQAEPSLECLHEILNKVFLTSQHPFKLGPKILHVLFEKFLCQDFSIQNFSSAVQFSMLEHYYSNPLSILCTHDDHLLDSIIEELSDMHMEQLRKMHSFQSYSDRKSLKEQEQLQTDDDYLTEFIQEKITELRHLLATLFPILRCLHTLTSKLPRSPFGKRFKDIYEYCLEKEPVKTETYRSAIALMRQTSRDELLSLLKQCCGIFEDAIKSDRLCLCLGHELKQLEILLNKFDDLDELQRQKELADEQSGPSKTQSRMPVYKNRFEFQERMKQAVKEKRATPYDNLRCDVIDFWDAVFRKYLRCPLNLPLNEIFFFDAKDSIIPHINATPRLATQVALKNPRHYLQCKCCNIDGEENRETLPDISIVYKIHLECGRMINLYDWLQAFISIVDPTPASKKNSKKRKAEDESLQYCRDDWLKIEELLGVTLRASEKINKERIQRSNSSSV